MEIIHSTEKFNVIKDGDKMGIQPLSLSVAILPFVQDGRGLPKQLGILTEDNPMRSGKSMTVITGKADGEDPDVLTTAQKRLLAITGLDVQDMNRWYFLGFLTTHKWVMQEIPCFAVDITGMVYNKPEDTDESKEFSIVGVNKALEADDCFIPAMFMKIFKFFGYTTQDENKEDQPKNSESNKTSVELLSIPGVIGAGETDKGWLIHAKPGTDKVSIMSKAKSIVGEDVEVRVEETPEFTEQKD